MARTLTITRRNAAFQQWQAMLTNRAKRQRAGEFVVQGVRPIDQAIGHDWPIHWVLFDRDRKLSSWAESVIARCDQTAALGSDLIAELGEKNEEPPEILVIGGMPEDDVARIPAPQDMLALALDRPSSPGNVGSIVRSADAMGATGVVITGHAADPYDPKAIRASTGSIFSVPVVRLAGPRDVADWADGLGAVSQRPTVIGMDEAGETVLWEASLNGRPDRGDRERGNRAQQYVAGDV